MTCTNCNAQILDNYYFCPNCGKKIKEPPFKFSNHQAVKIILLSILVPPFGIFPSIKYLLVTDMKAKIVGAVGIVLNIVILTLATIYLIKSINQTMDQINALTNPQGSIQNQIQTLQNP